MIFVRKKIFKCVSMIFVFFKQKKNVLLEKKRKREA